MRDIQRLGNIADFIVLPNFVECGAINRLIENRTQLVGGIRSCEAPKQRRIWSNFCQITLSLPQPGTQ